MECACLFTLLAPSFEGSPERGGVLYGCTHSYQLGLVECTTHATSPYPSNEARISSPLTCTFAPNWAARRLPGSRIR
jgi:hypothetical protein